MTIYSTQLDGIGEFKFSADLTQASATIYNVGEDGELSATQYQTADARHNADRALRLALSACGSEYYAAPNDERDDDEILDELCDGAEIEAEETLEERIARASDEIDATELVGEDKWAHYDNAMGRWYVVTADELAELCDYLDHDEEQISKDAYSHWCAGTSAKEMPEGWEPGLDAEEVAKDNKWRADVSRWIENVSFAVPPERQGQIVNHSYGCDGDYIYERIEDRSDRTVSVVVYEHPEEECAFEPWNGEPKTGARVVRVEIAQ